MRVYIHRYIVSIPLIITDMLQLSEQQSRLLFNECGSVANYFSHENMFLVGLDTDFLYR